jgi:hypothetical protein
VKTAAGHRIRKEVADRGWRLPETFSAVRVVRVSKGRATDVTYAFPQADMSLDQARIWGKGMVPRIDAMLGTR